MQQDVKWDIDIVVLHDWAEGAPARITYTNYVYDRSKEWSVACNLYAEVRRVLQHMKKRVLSVEIYGDDGKATIYNQKPIRLESTYISFCKRLSESKRHCTLSVYLKGYIEIRATAHKQTKRKKHGRS